jgi:hypothetical protein
MTRNRVEEFITASAKMTRVTFSSVENDIAYRWEIVEDTVEVMSFLGSLVKDDPIDVKSSAMIQL